MTVVKEGTFTKELAYKDRWPAWTACHWEFDSHGGPMFGPLHVVEEDDL